MPLDVRERKRLAAAANRLPVRVTIAAGDISDTVALHVERSFGDDGLMKVRISTDDRDACTLAAQRLAERLGCELVQLVGRVATLYRAPRGM